MSITVITIIALAAIAISVLVSAISAAAWEKETKQRRDEHEGGLPL